MTDRPPPTRSPWPWVVLVLGLAVVVAGTALWVLHSFRTLPGELVEGGRGMVRDLQRVAEAFRTGTVIRVDLSHATSVAGTQRLQVATLEETESFSLEDRASTLWGALELPAVAVEAIAPVQYTYYLDLEAPWHFFLSDHFLHVLTPPLAFNKPAIDASQITFRVVHGSLLRDEEAVQERLKQELTFRSIRRARENLSLVRDTARREVEGFVRTWLAGHFRDGGAYSVEVTFGDERSQWEEATGERVPEGGLQLPPTG